MSMPLWLPFTRIRVPICLLFFLFLSWGFITPWPSLCSSSPEIEECSVSDDFKAGNYKDIVERHRKKKLKGDCNMILLAKSFEKLGLYSQSNKILKDLYIKNTMYRDYVAYFIGNNLKKQGDLSGSLKWYKEVLLHPFKYQDTGFGTFDRDTIATASLEMLMNIGMTERKHYAEVVKILTKISNSYDQAHYYLGRLAYGKGNLNKAAEHFYKLIDGESIYYKKRVLELITKNFRLIRRINEMGMESEDLISLCLTNDLFDAALIVSYTLPYSEYIAKLRADCFFMIKDYKSSAVMYHEYYTHFRDPEALVQIAYSYYHEGKNESARSYLQKYIDHKGSVNNLSADGFFLNLQLMRKNNDPHGYARYAEYFVYKYKDEWNMDFFIQDTFYYLAQFKVIPLAVSFIKGTHPVITNPRFKAWAYYILGIYEDKKYFKDVVYNYPGSFYYFSAFENVSFDSDEQEADRLYSSQLFDEALDRYIQLFGEDSNNPHIKEKIQSIMSEKIPYKHVFDLQKVENGELVSILFELYRMGLFEEVKGFIENEFIQMDDAQRIFHFYLLSNISYLTEDIYGGIAAAEKMLEFIDNQYRLFLPDTVLKLLYPHIYQEIINAHLDDSEPFMNTCFILSIIREESRYHHRARSPKGALGLMQLMPETARWINEDVLKDDQLYDPSVNIETGIMYLTHLVKKFKTKHAVLAAYNGGPTNVRRWLSAGAADNPQQFIEEIPFPETRNYVKKVLTSYEIYKGIYSSSCLSRYLKE
jgi:soluble lytic murein transglycosylase